MNLPIRKFANAAAMLAMFGAVASASAATIPVLSVAVDGSLADWGVNLLNNDGSNIRPNVASGGSTSPLCTVPASQVWACEDSSDTATSGGFVGPQYGGQNYDVEFLGAARSGNNLFIGIASGLRPDNGFTAYAPGDLFFTINGVGYVVEMGGGTGGATTTIQTSGMDGAYYQLDSSGNTTVATQMSNQVIGSIWKVPAGAPLLNSSAISGGTNGVTSTSSWAGTVPTQFLRGTDSIYVGQATVFETLNVTPASYNQHAVVEVSIDMSIAAFEISNGYSMTDLHWGPACYNDVLLVAGLAPPTIPEPSTTLLFGLGMLGLIGLRRRVKKA